MRLLREYIKSVLEQTEHSEYPPEFIEVLNAYVRDSRLLNAAQKRLLQGWVAGKQLGSPMTLERVSERLPEELVGDTMSFNLASFTKVAVSQGKNAGQIGWKYSDKCIIAIPNATRGWEIDYNIVDVSFDASSEQEVLVTGNYKVERIDEITEPGTAPQYEYKIPYYVLKEA